MYPPPPMTCILLLICFAHCLLFSVTDLVTGGVRGAFPLALPSKLHSMARTHPLLQVPGLVFVDFRCGLLAVGGHSPSSCTFVKSTNLNLLSSRLHVTSPSSESLSRCSALLPSCPHPRVCYLLLRNAAERCGHGPMFAAGDSSGAVSIVTYQGVSVRVAGAEDSQDGAMVLEGAGHHSGAVACVAFARNVETHRSHTHTHTHTHTHAVHACACARSNINGYQYPVQLPPEYCRPHLPRSPSIEGACARFKHPNLTCIHPVRSESTLSTSLACILLLISHVSSSSESTLSTSLTCPMQRTIIQMQSSCAHLSFGTLPRATGCG